MKDTGLNENQVEQTHVLQNWTDFNIKDKDDVNEVKPFTLSLCREFLGGVWKAVSLDQFEITRLSGGLTNFVYKCNISDNTLVPLGNEPTKVLLKLYGSFHDDKATNLKDIVISTILGCQNLGPKPYAIFPLGRLEEFIEGKPMGFGDMHEPTNSRMIARLTAKFNSLEMPISKEPNWLFDNIERFLKLGREKTQAYQKDVNNKLYQKLMSYDLTNEFQQLKRVLKSIDSPIVFCHNDIQPTNILRTKDDVKIIDYEFGSYNFRGYEIGNQFCEWMYYNGAEEFPFFLYDYSSYPSREQQLNYIRAYIDETKSIRAKELENSGSARKMDEEPDLDEEKLLREANCFGLASHMLAASWGTAMEEPAKVTFGYLEYATARCDAYFKLKNMLFPNGFD